MVFTDTRFVDDTTRATDIIYRLPMGAPWLSLAHFLVTKMERAPKTKKTRLSGRFTDEHELMNLS